MITIRKATKSDDKSKILQLIYNTDKYIYPIMMDSALHNYEYILNDKGMYALDNITLALVDDEIAGLLISFYSDATPPMIQNKQLYNHYLNLQNSIEEDMEYINNVCVFDAYKRRGIASQLMQFIAQNTKKNKLVLDCLLQNTYAIQLYEKLGFVRTQIDKAFCIDASKDIQVVRMEKQRK